MGSPTSTTRYPVKLTAQSGLCFDEFPATVDIHPSVALNILPGDTVLCSNETVQFKDQSVGIDAGKWYYRELGTNDHLGEKAGPQPRITYTMTNNTTQNPIIYEVVYEASNDEGCTGFDTVTVKVDNSNKNNYLLPNAFTPNNDGLNDCFGIKYWGVVEKFEFSIYNRWGERLFATKNPSQCWDGTFKGIPQDGGVYVYMIKAKTSCEAEVFRKGTFTLVK